MRRILFSILLAAGFVLAADNEETIRQAEKGWAAAVVANDVAAVEKALHNDLLYAHSSGQVETKAEYVGNLKTGSAKYDGIEHSSITVKLFGTTAIAHSRVRMHGKNASGPFDNKLMMIHVWLKQAGRWQLVAHQTTKLP